jgi:hypothetical protein
MVKGAHSSNKLVRIGALLDAVVSVGIGIIRALARVLEMTPSSISSALLQGCLCGGPPPPPPPPTLDCRPPKRITLKANEDNTWLNAAGLSTRVKEVDLLGRSPAQSIESHSISARERLKLTILLAEMSHKILHN